LKGQLIKEKGEIKNEASGFEIDYIYKDDKLSEWKSLSEFDDFIIDMNEKYYYSTENKLTKRNYQYFSLDINNKDTISQQIAVFLYDSNEVQIESDWSDAFDDYSNFKEYYFYNDSELLVKKNKYHKISKEIDSFIFKYKYDNNNNWIERKSFENDTLKRITERKIEYK